MGLTRKLVGGCFVAWLMMSASSAVQAGENAPGDNKPGEVDLTPAQLKFVKVVKVQQTDFPVDRDAVGNTDFNQDRTVQISPPYQGRILQVEAVAGQVVRKGQVLFTLESPDLVQAESTLLSAAGTRAVTTAALQRVPCPRPGKAWSASRRAATASGHRAGASSFRGRVGRA